MFQTFSPDAFPGFGANGQPAPPSEAEAVLLWAARRLVFADGIMRPRCPAVHVALQQHFGGNGGGVEHLLRCCLFGLGQAATRRLAFAEPASPGLLPDEQALLGVLRLAGQSEAGQSEAGAGAALAALTGSTAGAGLAPLFGLLAALVRP